MIYTFGDGFATGHIWPEWPQMLELITQQPVENYGQIGAGNEYIFNCAVRAAINSPSSDIFVVQWALPFRFDKLIEDDSWAEIIQTDNIYNNNFGNIGGKKWWLSSNSKLDVIKHYTNFYVQSEQLLNRTVLHMITLNKLLESKNIKHCYFFTYNVDYSTHDLCESVESLPWTANVSMEDYSTRFSNRGVQIQPSPIVHLNFTIDNILPALNLSVDQIILDKIKNYFDKIDFFPYHFDREQQLADIKNEISLFFK
jgi:hypothetical protein